MQIVVAGDFNRRDILWGGAAISGERQGKAKPIIEIMGSHGLSSLLKSGTITRDQGGDASTINLILVSQNLANSVIFCKILNTDHGSDHLAIESSFDLETPFQTPKDRLLFKEAPWQRIRERVSNTLLILPVPTDTQEKCDRLINAVAQAVRIHTLIVKPSPFAKRWWSKELINLRGM